MPRRKKMLSIPDYIDTGSPSDELLVQKSNPLQSLSETELTLPEFKILDAYLARINSHDKEKRTVKFEKGKLEELLGVSRILKDDLDKRLRHLFQVVEIKDETKRKGFKLVSLFEEADAEPDENGLWQITLTCTPSAREYVFNIDNIGYLRYRLKNVINLTSRYSYILFLYLENNRFRKSWEVSLSELKRLLNCTAETYNTYYRFNDLVLKKCQKELTEKTDIRYSYEPIKKGRKVTGIKFILETLADVEPLQLENQITFNTTPALDEDEALKKYGSERISFIAEACNYEFSAEEMRVLLDIIVQLYPDSQDQIARYNYLMRKYNELKLWASREKINNRFSYLKKLLENDLKKQAVCS